MSRSVLCTSLLLKGFPVQGWIVVKKIVNKGLRILINWMTPRVLPSIGSNKLAKMRRMFQGLAVMTALGSVAVFAPYIAGDSGGMIIAALLACALLGMSAAVWWQIRHSHDEAAEEVLLREAFHSMLTPQLITDHDGHLIMASRAFRGWINVGKTPVIQMMRERFGGDEERDEKFEEFYQKLLKGQSVIGDFSVVRGERIIEWRRIMARPIDGSNRYYHWRFQDISERRRMERAMQDEQDKLVDFMAHAPVGIYSVDQHGRFKFVNETMANWLQTTPDGLVQGDVRIHDVLNNSPSGVAAYAVAIGAQGEKHGEVVLRRRDLTFFPAAITQTIVKSDDGKGLRTRSIVRDLSPEREWQMALFASEYRFQRLFAEAPIGIVLLDAKHVVMECNQAFLAIARRQRDGVISLPVFDLLSPQNREMIQGELVQVMDGKDLIKPIEAHIHADRVIIVQVFAKRFGSSTAEGGPPDGLMLYFIDVTEQKTLEDQFSQSQKMQAIGQLAGGVAHDFNNLLTAMNGFCDLLLQRHKPGDQSFSDIMQIRQNGNRAATLVRQLLAFSRQQTLQPKTINIVDVVSELTNLLRRLIGAQIKFDMIHGRDIGLVKVDQGQLEQVVINLVVNARDAMASQSTGSVLVRTSNHIQVETIMCGQDEMPPGRYVAIEVVDTGSGIPADVIPRIFEPFFSTKEIGSGTGLGLSTVYGVVRQTGGFINVHSEIDKGTHFTVYIPALTQEDEAKSVEDDQAVIEEQPAPDLTGFGTILLVEDEEAVRMFSSRALRNKGYVVFEANSGEEALEVLEKEGEKVDLIVTDVVMPEMDGPTLYKHIQKRWPSMKVIFVSGYTEDRLREQFTSGEEINFLGKPFSLKQLASKVKEIFQDS